MFGELGTQADLEGNSPGTIPAVKPKSENYNLGQFRLHGKLSFL
jgi:hypothetical protein